MTLRNLLAIKDLAGLRIARIYYARIRLEIFQFCPAVQKRNRRIRIVVCLNKRDLVSVIKKLPPQEFEIVRELAIINKAKGVGIFLTELGKGGNLNEIVPGFQILTRQEIEKKLGNKSPAFEWRLGEMSKLGILKKPSAAKFQRQLRDVLAKSLSC